MDLHHCNEGNIKIINLKLPCVGNLGKLFRNGEDGAIEEVTTNLVNIQCMNYPFMNLIYHDHMRIRNKLLIKKNL
jgi:hypothetical protein